MGERQRGRLTSVSERTQYVTWIREAKESGARLPLACDEAGISLRTYKRWYQNGKVLADKRPDAVRPTPTNKLSELEQTAILSSCNEGRFKSLPPTQIVPTLLDEGIYLGSESTFYRVLKQHGQLHHRGRRVVFRILCHFDKLSKNEMTLHDQTKLRYGSRLKAIA